jgi:hypothetical protein
MSALVEFTYHPKFTEEIMRMLSGQMAMLSLLVALPLAMPSTPYLCLPAQASTDQIATTTQLPVSKAISSAALKKYEQVSVTVEADGKKVSYSGVPLRAILADMVPELNLNTMPGWKSLSKQELVMEVLGSDGYPGLVTGTEIAINKSGDRFLLATQRDGKPNESGIQLICRMDEARTRWVREVVSLRVVTVANK